eukprot:UN11232
MRIPRMFELGLSRSSSQYLTSLSFLKKYVVFCQRRFSFNVSMRPFDYFDYVRHV